MSAAWSPVSWPLIARNTISCIFIARSTAGTPYRMSSPPQDMLYTVPAQSGHFTCSRERTDHKSTTKPGGLLDKAKRPVIEEGPRFTGGSAATGVPRRVHTFTQGGDHGG